VSITFTGTSYLFDADTTGICKPKLPCICRRELTDLSQFSNKLTLSPTTTRTFTSRGTVSRWGTITLTAGSAHQTITMNIIGRAY